MPPFCLVSSAASVASRDALPRVLPGGAAEGQREAEGRERTVLLKLLPGRRVRLVYATSNSA